MDQPRIPRPQSAALLHRPPPFGVGILLEGERDGLKGHDCDQVRTRQGRQPADLILSTSNRDQGGTPTKPAPAKRRRPDSRLRTGSLALVLLISTSAFSQERSNERGETIGAEHSVQERGLGEEAAARPETILREMQKLAEAGVHDQPSQAPEIAIWLSRIQLRIRNKLVVPPNTSLDAQASYEITLSPEGEVLSTKQLKSSGYPPYDAAIQRAISWASPLPVPSDPALFLPIRTIKLVLLPASEEAQQYTRSLLQPVPSTDAGGEPVIHLSRPPGSSPQSGQSRQAAVPSDTEAAAISQFVLQIQSSLGRLVRERPDRAYPPLARDQGWEGISQVRVEFVSGGKVKSIEVVISSGYAALDQRAREMVKEVMPKVPDELRDREFSVRFPIVFKRFNR